MRGLPKRLLRMVCGLVGSLVIGAAAAEVVVVVSEQSPVSAVSSAELADIYLGRSNRFPNGEPVVPIDQSERAPAHDDFYSNYLGRTASQIKAHWSKLIFTGRGQPPRSFNNGDAVADFISENPHAIGYVDRSVVDGRLRVVNIE